MKNIFLILTIVFCCRISTAQITLDRQVIGSTGNLTISGPIQASSNVGETIISTFSKPTLIVTQGIEQPDMIFVSLPEVQLMNITAYPNPTMSNVVLDFSIDKTMDIFIDTYNEKGQQMGTHLKSRIQNNDRKELDFSCFASGSYFIVIKSIEGELIRKFTVQKIN